MVNLPTFVCPTLSLICSYSWRISLLVAELTGGSFSFQYIWMHHSPVFWLLFYWGFSSQSSHGSFEDNLSFLLAFLNDVSVWFWFSSLSLSQDVDSFPPPPLARPRALLSLSALPSCCLFLLGFVGLLESIYCLFVFQHCSKILSYYFLDIDCDPLPSLKVPVMSDLCPLYTSFVYPRNF